MADASFYEGVLRQARAEGNRQAEAAALGSLGNLYGSQGDPSKGLSYLEQAVTLRSSLGDWDGVGSAYMGMAGIYEMVLDDDDAGIQYLKKAHAAARGATQQERLEVMLRARGAI
jgi:hypothetical protein